MKKKKIEIDIVALEFFCAGASIDLICTALAVPRIAVEEWIRDRINYLHSEKP